MGDITAFTPPRTDEETETQIAQPGGARSLLTTKLTAALMSPVLTLYSKPWHLRPSVGPLGPHGQWMVPAPRNRRATAEGLCLPFARGLGHTSHPAPLFPFNLQPPHLSGPQAQKEQARGRQPDLRRSVQAPGPHPVGSPPGFHKYWLPFCLFHLLDVHEELV